MMTTQYHLVDKDFKNNIVLDSASAVLVEDGVVWDQAELQMSLNYENTALIENNNESYLSENDDGNGTQYFSLLEHTNEHVLNDLNDITLYTDGENQVQISDQENVNMICTLEDQQQHNVLAESGDLYAFQVAYDEEGNVQKYRYMLRLNEDGEYETVPESLELLPEDIELPINEMLPVEEQQTEYENPKVAYRGSDFIIKKEEREDLSHCNGDTYQDIHISEPEEFYKNQMFQENVETKLAAISQNGSDVHKIEASSETSNESTTTYNPSNFDQEDNNFVPIKPILNSTNNHALQIDELHLNNFDEMYTLQQETTHDNEETSADAFEEEQLVISDGNQQGSDTIISHNDLNIVNGTEHTELTEDINGNESEEEFQIVDGVHVTADTDGHEEIIPPVEVIASKDSRHQVLKLQENMAFFNNTLDDIKIKQTVKKNGNKANKHLLYYVVKDPEKENLVSLSDGKKITKANPRSVLKSSFICFEEQKDSTKSENQTAKNEKKLVKPKENKGKMLQNYIAKTTIILAPVRQERMPRKQTIKPVKRADEEIIVQEVVVSSNGFVETKEDGVLKSKTLLAPTDFVQVSDSDEDYNVRTERKKKKKKKKRRSKVTKIVITDTEDEDCDESVVEIDLSLDSDQERDAQKGGVNEVTDQEDGSTLADSAKRRRGRPRKRPSSSLEESSSSSSSKKLKSTNESENSDVSTLQNYEVGNINTEWACSSCAKVFPSQGSLKTHMQYHSYRESVNKRNSFKKPLPTAFKTNNYKCTICFEMFKNKYLLTKHTSEHNDPRKFECSFCKKLFSDQLQLTNHRRSHVKEHMFNSTTLPKDSPKSKKLGNSRSNLLQLHEKYKCSFCSKVFTSQTLLDTHSSLHKRYVCLSCKSTFISKLALEDHVQRSCVKQLTSHSPLKMKHLHTRNCPSSKKCAVKSDISNSSIKNIRSSLSSNLEKKTPHSAKQLDLKCDKCSAVFKSHKNLFTHKVLQHGLETPDKSIRLNKNKTVVRKELGNHSSVPAGEKLKNAFANFRTLK